DPQAPRYIQTVHRRGYRFLAPLSEDGGLTPDSRFAVASGDRAVSATAAPGRGWELLPLIAAGLSGLLLAALAWGTLETPRPEAPLAARFEVRPAAGTSFALVDRRTPAI